MSSRQERFAAAALVVTGLFFAACSAEAQTRPNPPPMICVNNQCATTGGPGGGQPSGAIKWNPGHYMASGTVLYGGGGISSLQNEMNDLNNQDAIQGYRVWVTWG